MARFYRYKAHAKSLCPDPLNGTNVAHHWIMPGEQNPGKFTG
jgi:hypothetical protein